MDILTTYRTDASGKGKVTAKGGGTPTMGDGTYNTRQRTISYDHSRSVAQNHGDAAGTLANTFGITVQMTLWATAEDLGDGKWRFTL